MARNGARRSWETEYVKDPSASFAASSCRVRSCSCSSARLRSVVSQHTPVIRRARPSSARYTLPRAPRTCTLPSGQTTRNFRVVGRIRLHGVRDLTPHPVAVVGVHHAQGIFVPSPERARLEPEERMDVVVPDDGTLDEVPAPGADARGAQG